MVEEGWYTDPYGRHEARWLSDGKPTKLVRDGHVESCDDPPEGPTVTTPVPVEPEPAAANGEDLRRADDAERGEPFDQEKVTRAVLDVFDREGGQLP
jgi:hypothetical protein